MTFRHRHLPKYEIGAHFLTAKTFHNTPYFSVQTCARIFCEELETARVRYGFDVLAFVVMPDHVHLLLWWDTDELPDLTISKVAWAVKGKSARRIVAYLKEQNGVGEGSRVGEGTALAHPTHKKIVLQPARKPGDKPHRRNWRYRLWQPGAGYDFNVYTPHKLVQKVRYIHANPVRAGLSATPEEYLWSSAGNYAGLVGIHDVRITFYTEVL